jgi:hypothetical protein
LKETASSSKTDINGKGFSFTMPEVLTCWKLQLLAHTTALANQSNKNPRATQKN